MTIEFLRQFKIGGFAIFDLATAFLGIQLLAPVLAWPFKKLGWEIPRRSWLLLTLPIGILVHFLIGRHTPLTVDFLDPHSHYLAKAGILILIIFGVKGIKKIKK
jgi:hypothetical protein